MKTRRQSSHFLTAFSDHQRKATIVPIFSKFHQTKSLKQPPTLHRPTTLAVPPDIELTSVPVVVEAKPVGLPTKVDMGAKLLDNAEN